MKFTIASATQTDPELKVSEKGQLEPDEYTCTCKCPIHQTPEHGTGVHEARLAISELRQALDSRFAELESRFEKRLETQIETAEEKYGRYRFDLRLKYETDVEELKTDLRKLKNHSVALGSVAGKLERPGVGAVANRRGEEKGVRRGNEGGGSEYWVGRRGGGRDERMPPSLPVGTAAPGYGGAPGYENAQVYPYYMSADEESEEVEAPEEKMVYDDEDYEGVKQLRDYEKNNSELRFTSSAGARKEVVMRRRPAPGATPY